mmetsp:Transcript_4722/g.11605  ORF Transcript_4722/g.11605 Transcript_4722/m.11605 type:complete len:303 (-) Transcript_4722:87-995(-)
MTARWTARGRISPVVFVVQVECLAQTRVFRVDDRVRVPHSVRRFVCRPHVSQVPLRLYLFVVSPTPLRQVPPQPLLLLHFRKHAPGARTPDSAARQIMLMHTARPLPFLPRPDPVAQFLPLFQIADGLLLSGRLEGRLPGGELLAQSPPTLVVRVGANHRRSTQPVELAAGGLQVVEKRAQPGVPHPVLLSLDERLVPKQLVVVDPQQVWTAKVRHSVPVVFHLEHFFVSPTYTSATTFPLLLRQQQDAELRVVGQGPQRHVGSQTVPPQIQIPQFRQRLQVLQLLHLVLTEGQLLQAAAQQ